MAKTVYERDMENSLQLIALALGMTQSGTPDVAELIQAAVETGKDTKRLEWLYSGAKTDSYALVEAEMKLLDGKSLTLEEARAAIDDAMSTPPVPSFDTADDNP